jgi:hypothetical protein
MFFGNVNAQKLNGTIETIKEALQTVASSKAEFAQNLKLNTTNYVNYSATEVDNKGNTEETIYNFSFADIDINTVRTVTKKDIILVQLIVKGKQRLIKKITNNGDKVSYVDNLSMYAKNIDNGRDLVEAIKNTIPINETLEKNKLALSSYQDHQNWLASNIQDVDFTKSQIVQKLEPGKLNNGYLKLSTTTNSKSKTSTEEFEFNLATLNPNSLSFKISGDEFYIEASNRRNIKVIKAFKDGVQQSYTSKIRFYSSSIENAKDTYKVLKAIIPLAEQAFLKSKPNTTSIQNAYKYINSAIQNVTTNDQTYTQNIAGDCITKIIIKEANLKETVEHIYSFNFGDINLDNIDYNSSKNQLFVEINTRKQAKFIRHVENNELQNYTNSFKLYVGSIEEAMITKEALQHIVKNCDNTKTEENYSSITNALDILKKDITLVKVGDNSYDQTFEVVSTSPYVVKLTSVFSNLKTSKETIYEFGLGDINSKNIAITTSGKYAMVELNTKHLEKIIKTYQDGEIKSYAYKISIQSTDIENARKIASILKYTTKKLE